MTTTRKIQRDSYKLSRAAGDLAALQSGGIPRLAKRVLRRKATRSLFNLFGNFR